MTRISIQNLSADFPIFGSKSRSLKMSILSQATGGRLVNAETKVVTVRALDDISLEVHDGDRIGLVGHNGSGKTTLLRIIAGIYKPTAGRIDMTGSLGALLNPSAGIDPEATGIENIYLRGYLLGLSRRQIEERLEEIGDFTQLGSYLELPVKTYSAGMSARLAFAISTAADNDILLMDEGIGAGDAAFFERAQQRVNALIHRTPIVLLASHDANLISQLCNRRVTMEQGRIVADEPI